MYSLLKSYPIEINNTDDDNHIYIHTVAAGQDYSIAVNVASNVKSAPLYYAIKYIKKQKLEQYLKLDEGLYSFKHHEFEPLLYYKQNWIDKNELKRAEVLGNPNNKLGETVVQLVEKAMSNPDSYILAFGELWGPKAGPDWTFGFSPACGLHDVHFNESGLDGACFFCNKEDDDVVGIFATFIHS